MTVTWPIMDPDTTVADSADVLAYGDDVVERVRQETLLSVRREIDQTWRGLLGDDYDTPACLGVLVTQRAVRERRREMDRRHVWSGSGVFMVSRAAMHALERMPALQFDAGEAPRSPLSAPVSDRGSYMFGRRVVEVSPTPQWYATPGKAWVRRHVTQSWVETGPGVERAQQILGRLAEDWCLENGLETTGRVVFEWKEKHLRHAGGRVWAVAASAETRRLSGVFLG